MPPDGRAERGSRLAIAYVAVPLASSHITHIHASMFPSSSLPQSHIQHYSFGVTHSAHFHPHIACLPLGWAILTHNLFKRPSPFIQGNMADTDNPEVPGQDTNNGDTASDDGSEWQDINDTPPSTSIDFVTLGMFIIGKLVTQTSLVPRQPWN